MMKFNKLVWPRIAVATVAILLQASCEVGPNYSKPKPSVPTAFDENKPSTRPSETSSSGEPVEQWWTTLGDPELNKLIDGTVKGNLDMQIAAQRFIESRSEERRVGKECR